jgi:uncharacterized repeat protein (TIGR02543 family)
MYNKYGFPLLCIVAALLAVPNAAAEKYVAVVEVEIDATSGASDYLSHAEAREITAELRREAVKNLPTGKFNIMTSETVQAQSGAVLEECLEENCVITLGAKIGADYIVRGIVRKFKTLLTLSVEMYETEDGTLVASSDPVRSENAADLLMKTAAACANMYKTFASSQGSAWKAPATPSAHTITTAANPPNGGSVSRTPDQTTYTSGTTVSVTAVPANGYAFTGWSGASNSKKATLTAPIDRDLTLTANFQPTQRMYTLKTNVYPQGGGYVFRNPNKETYTDGELVTLTATPASDYKFTDWIGSGSGRKNRLTLTMDGDKTVTANFYRKLKLDPTAQKPDAGLDQEEPPAKKRHTLAAVSLDVVGAGVLVYGYTRDMSVKDFIDKSRYTDAETSVSQRNTAYTLGALILLSGISVHIFF